MVAVVTLICALWLQWPAFAAAQSCRNIDHSSGAKINTCYSASDDHIKGLMSAAIDGMGLRVGQGPIAGDSIFVGRWLAAWIDNTGFYSKLNGLWTMNGKDGDDLDFSLTEPDLLVAQRPINFLVVGERGDGQWSAYDHVFYRGAERYEFIRFAADNKTETGRAMLEEVQPYSRRTTANAGDIDKNFAAVLGAPIVSNNGQSYTYENAGQLKMLELTGADNNLQLGGPFVFNNQQAGGGDMQLKIHYIFDTDSSFFVKNYQLINNSPFDYASVNSFDKLIGGPVVTTWPQPFYLKYIPRFWSATDDALYKHDDDPAKSWSVSNVHFELTDKNSISLSATGQFTPGRSVKVEQDAGVGDFGFCKCGDYQGLELTGSVLSGLTVPAHSSSVVQSRKYTLGNQKDGQMAPGVVTSTGWDGSEADVTFHDLGVFTSGDGWEEPSLGGALGYLLAHKVFNITGSAIGSATFVLLIDIVTGHNDADITNTISLYDVGNDKVLASQDLRRDDFFTGMVKQRFTLGYAVSGPWTAIEPRVYFHQTAFTKAYGVKLNFIWTDAQGSVAPLTIPTLNAPSVSSDSWLGSNPDASLHDVGALDNNDGWALAIGDAKNVGFLFAHKTFGVDPAGVITGIVTFSLQTDVAGGTPQDPDMLAVISVVINNTTVASRDIKKSEFTAVKTDQLFSLNFRSTDVASGFEPKLYYNNKAWLKLTGVSVQSSVAVQSDPPPPSNPPTGPPPTGDPSQPPNDGSGGSGIIPPPLPPNDNGGGQQPGDQQQTNTAGPGPADGSATLTSNSAASAASVKSARSMTSTAAASSARITSSTKQPASSLSVDPKVAGGAGGNSFQSGHFFVILSALFLLFR